MVTLKTIAQSIQPAWTLNEWFQWPPNAFALISIVLQRTGSYKICLIENAWWEDKDWMEDVDDDSDTWLRATGAGIEHEKMTFLLDGYYILHKEYQLLERDWNLQDDNEKINLNDLRTLGDVFNEHTSPKDIKLKDYAIALVSILAIADACCAGLGFISPQIAKEDIECNLFKPVANLLLTTTGSLSTIPKFHGTVLPKMRTPQSGVVLRSLSHHLTFHATEVEVIWRTFPWLNDDKLSLNLLVVPYPNKIRKTDFNVVQENYHSVRYFKGKIQEHIDIDYLDALIKKVFSKASTNNQVDLLVFPEMALSEKQYNYLLNKFAEVYTSCSYTDESDNGRNFCLQLPIIISGVLHENGTDKDNGPMNPMHNEVRMAVFFAGKWYDITQRKHHRWQLDRNQIVQYGLEGYFPTDRKWFELCSILQRRLTILAPNGWLALTALICEDLARQEPVAEVIRGVGPTLLMALLSDGPQVNTRWSARYASVLADDPGTAVLSLTSIGMSKRAQRPDSYTPTKEDKLTVGLWKDMIRGWKELNLEKDKHALLFTISAKFEKEYTLDGRSDGENASVFKMDSMNPQQITFDLDKDIVKEKELAGLDEKALNKIHEMTKSKGFGNWHDIRELSAIMFAIDSIVDLLTVHDINDPFSNLLEIIIKLLQKKGRIETDANLFAEIKCVISESWEEPNTVGTAAIKHEYISAGSVMEADVKEIRDLITEILNKRGLDDKANFFDILIDICEERILRNIEGQGEAFNRIPMAFLYNVNTKLSSFKTPRELHQEVKGKQVLSPKEAMNITRRIDSILNKHLIRKMV